MADSLEKYSSIFFILWVCFFFCQRQYRQVFLIFYTVDDLEHTLTIWLSMSLSEISFLSTASRSILGVLNFILKGREHTKANF